MFRKIKAAYDNLKPPARASFWFLICGFLQKGISMITTPVFTRIMVDAEFGKFSVYNTWQNVIQILVSLNLAAGVYTRGLVKNEGDQDRFSSSMMGLSTTCILVWSVFYFIFQETINRWLDLSTLLMAAMLVEIWAHAGYQFWTNRERVNYRYKKLIGLTLVYVVLSPVLGAVAVQWADTNSQAEARVITTAAVNVALFAALYVSTWKRGKQFFNKTYWKYALKFNIPLVPHYLSQIVLNQSDKLMINHFLGPAQAAYYSVAYTLAAALQILNNSIAATMNPWIYKTIKEKRVKHIGKTSYRILLLIAVLNYLVVLAAPEILKILAPEKYQVAVWVIPPVTVSVYFMFLYNLFVTFEFYFEKTHYVTGVTIFSAVLNIVLNAIFIPRFGCAAAGYTTLICYIVCALLHYNFMRKVVKEFCDNEKVYEGKIIAAIGAALMLCSALTMLLYEYVIIRYLLVAAIVAVCIAKREQLLRIVNFKKTE